MKILLVSSSSGSRGGGEIFLIYLGKALKEAGHEAILWCSTNERMDELAQRFSEFGEVVRSPYRNSYLDRPFRLLGAWFDKATSSRLAAEWKAIHPDVIHINKQTTEDGLDLIAAAEKAEIPTVSTIHLTQSNRELKAVGAPARDFIARRTMRACHTIPLTAVSDTRASSLQNFLDRKVTTIYNGVSDSETMDSVAFRSEVLEKYSWDEDTVLAVCVARLVPQKDPERFIRLAGQIHRRNDRFRFLWVGDGELRDSFLRLVSDSGLTGIIECSGWESEPRRYLAAADLYLHPAAYEGLPLSIIQAMSASLP